MPNINNVEVTSGSEMIDARLSHKVVEIQSHETMRVKWGQQQSIFSGKVDLHDRILGLSKQGRDESRLVRSTSEHYVSMFVHIPLMKI